MSLKSRIERIQRTVGVKADGIVGVNTVSALERALGITPADAGPVETPASSNTHSLTLSRKGLDQIVAHEISSERYYTQHLSAPVWPGGASGATIGIGYDLGYRTKTAVKTDWGAHLPESTIAHLASAAGIRGDDAKGVTRSLKQAGVRVPLESAKTVFYTASLPEFATLTRKTYPGVEKLPPDAQSALVSLVYNRGGSLKGAARKEMASIKGHVKNQDLEAIAKEIEAMKRLWEGKGLDGLLKRRDQEARMVRRAQRTYDPAELVYV